MAAIAVAPTRHLRLSPNSAFRYRSLYRKPIFNPLPNFPTSLPNPILLRPYPFPDFSLEVPRRRCLCTVISGEAVETTKQDVVPDWKGQLGGKVGEFRKKLKVVDIKSGPHEGLDFLGQTLVVKGWVRTLRVQSSVTFVEINDGSCLSNMQCVMDSDVEGYDQVENGLVTTGASIWVQGMVVRSQGSKQKVELKLKKIVGKSDPSFPIQKKRVSREFLRTKAHLRPRTNTFGAVARVRNALSYATHKFFQENGFVWVSSPIISQLQIVRGQVNSFV